MNSRAKNLLIALLALTTLGGAAMVVQTRRELAALRAAPTLQVTRSEFTASAAPAALPATPAEAAPAPAAETPMAEPVGGPPEGFGRGERGGGASFAAQLSELMKDEEFAAAWKLDQEARIEQRYGALFAELKLPPQQLAALRTLLAERDNAGREVFASAAAQGLNPRENRDQLRALANELQAEVDANISATLGDNVLQAINGYNSTTPQRNVVNDLSQRLTSSSLTLNKSQSTALTQILTETGQSSGRNNVLITNDTIARAQGVLMPSQVEALRSLQAEQQARITVETKMRAAREAARQAGETRRND